MQTARSITEASSSGNARTRAGADSFCVIIPTLNEERAITRTITHLREFPEVSEVIVVDGGSTDRTQERARTLGARVVHAPRGRGPQMNAGARSARPASLLFLHADCRLPAGAFNAIGEVFAGGCDAGVFAIDYASRHPVLRLLSALSRLQTPWTEFGEAALFVRRARFEAVGGFPEWPLMEDCEILARLRRCGALGKARDAVTASARRFEERGVVRQLLHNLALFTLYKCGLSPVRLQRFYAPVRSTASD